MELFTATGKLKKFFFTTRDVRCVHGTHRYDTQGLATHASTLMRVWQELEYIIDECHVSRGAHIEYI